jgi:hypothetical protein
MQASAFERPAHCSHVTKASAAVWIKRKATRLRGSLPVVFSVVFSIRWQNYLPRINCQMIFSVLCFSNERFSELKRAFHSLSRTSLIQFQLKLKSARGDCALV